jgi:hypothetical protein
MKIRKSLTILIIAIPTLFIILYFCGLLIYKNQWKYEYSKTQMHTWVDEINKTPNLETNFWAVFDTLGLNGSELTLNFEYLQLVKFHFTGVKHFHRGSGKNYYIETANLLLMKHNKEINSLLNPKLTLAFGLEKKVQVEKCINYYYNNLEISLLTDSSTCHKLKGVTDFTKFYFGKEPHLLNQNEIITTISAFDMAYFKDTLTHELIMLRTKVNEYILEKKR